MKIQPVDFPEALQLQLRSEVAVKLLFKSRFKRLFERPFSGVSKVSSPEKQAVVGTDRDNGSEEFEPSTACLSKMVQNYMEEDNDKHLQKCGRNRCNCFNGKYMESSDEVEDSYKSSLSGACDVLMTLVPCLVASERNLLADVSRLVETNKISKQLKDEACRRSVVDGLIAVGYKASIYKSKWEKSPMCPPGEHEYIEVVIDGDRLITDIDFRSEFEIARSTKAYRLVLQMLPNIFVGKADRLEKIIDVVSEAAKLSLKKKGMSFPPWRKADYMKAKWLSPSPVSKDKPPFIPKGMEGGTKLKIQDCGQIQNCLPPLEFKRRNLRTRNKSSSPLKVKTGLASIIDDHQTKTPPRGVLLTDA